MTEADGVNELNGAGEKPIRPIILLQGPKFGKLNASCHDQNIWKKEVAK